MSMPTTYRKCPAEPRDSKQLIFRFWEQLTQHALTSSLLHLFSIGLNSDEAGDLLFFLHFVRWVSDCYKTIFRCSITENSTILSKYEGKPGSLTRLAVPQSGETYPNKQTVCTGRASVLYTSRLPAVWYVAWCFWLLFAQCGHLLQQK